MRTFSKSKISVLIFLIMVVILSGVLFACKPDTNDTLYTISFQTNSSEEIASIEVAKGKNIIFPIPKQKIGYTFTAWCYDAACTQKVNPSTFTAARDITLYALWTNNETLPHNIILPQLEHGTITANKSVAMFEDRVEITIIPFSGYEIIVESVSAVSEYTNKIVVNAFTKDEPQAELAKNFYFRMPAENVELSVDFKLRQYNLSVREMPNGMIKIDKQWAVMGEIIDIEVVPNAGYTLSNIRLNGTVIDELSFEMEPYDIEIMPEFKPINNEINYDINIYPSQNGQVIASAIRAPEGRFVYLDIIAEKGYVLSSLTINNQTAEQLYFVMPNKKVDIQANFVPIDYDNLYDVVILDNDNGQGTTAKVNYAKGEIVQVEHLAGDGYVFDAIVVNGHKIVDDYFIMPSENVEIELIFAENPIDIIINCNNGGSIFTSTDTAKVGEWVEIVPMADKGYRLDRLTLNGQLITAGFYQMSGSGMVINATFSLISVASGDEEYSIIVVTQNGEITLSHHTAYKGEVIYITDIFASEGYLFDNESLKYNNIHFDKYFVMPNKNVEVTASFNKLYNISFYDGNDGKVIAHKDHAIAGEQIELFAIPNGGYLAITSNTNIKVNNGEIHLSNMMFTMPNKDVVISAAFNLSAEAEYKITIASANGGRVSSNFATAKQGTPIHLTITPEKGFTLDTVYYGNNIVVSDSFLMPNVDIVLTPIFKPIVVNNSVLQEIFSTQQLSFKQAGIDIKYISTSKEISTFLSSIELQRWSGSIAGIISISHNTQSILLECNSGVAEIAQALKYHYDSAYPQTDYFIKDNIIVVSIGSKAVEDYYMAVHGIDVLPNFILYTRESGSKGVLTYTGTSEYVILPSYHDGRAVTMLASGALNSAAYIKELSLSLVREIGEGVLHPLTKLKSLDLSNISIMSDMELYNCISLEKIYVASYNTKYYTKDGVLYEVYTQAGTRKHRLLRYPVGKTATEYTVIDSCDTIKPYAFYKSNLQRVDIRNVLTIGEYAFAYNTSLTKINCKTTLANNNNDDYAFNLENVLQLYDYAFLGCYSVTTVFLNNLNIIGESVFVIGNNTLNITLSRKIVNGSANSIVIDDGIGKLLIQVYSDTIDTFRQASVWKNYANYFTIRNPLGKHVVLFDSCGGSYISTPILSTGFVATKPPNPTKQGFIFDNWYLDADYTVSYDFSYAFNKNTVLYARFLPLT